MRHNLFSWLLKGVPFWDFIRHLIYEEIVSAKKLRPELHVPPPPSRKSRIKDFMRETLALIPYSAKRLRFKAKGNVDIVLFDIDNRRLMDGKWVDPVTYPIVKELRNKHRLLVLDRAALWDSVSGRYPCPVVSIRGDFLKSRLLARFDRLRSQEKSVVQKLRKLLQAEFQTEIDVESFIEKHFFYQIRLTKLLQKRLKKYGPKLVLFQNNFTRYFMLSAHQAGIKAVELQHGATNYLDLNTSYPETLPPSLPTLPDEILTFGSYWNPLFHSPAPKSAVGFPYFESQAREVLAKNIRRRPKTLIGISVMDPALLECLYEFARKMPDFTVYYKLRPEEFESWKSFIPERFQRQPNLFFIDNHSKPLYEYFCECEYLISSCSTALYEGLYFGTKTLVFKGYYHEMMEDLVESGYALAVTDDEELIRLTASHASPPRVPGKESFYRSRALDNMGREIERLFKGNVQ